ncbi:drug:proton antiporter [Jiella endophytica]|uniref:Drug:proton antiporter n=1 Tax=Jiella endophytica TaxID=2558362 RepID=A0A4Y8RSN1_9HYPH|nr:drug:proton antiporter [Jiella endophytica]TFF27329.1 drug:proton antiporter [Jiella endophytica]
MSEPLKGAPYTLLYTDDVTRNAAKLERFFGFAPVEYTPGFALFFFGEGKLGLWKIDAVEPRAKTRPGACEFALSLEGGPAAVDAAAARAFDAQLTILQEPTQMDFGYTFVAALGDGNRIRAFARSASPA